ncbi:MAG: UvrB/UvrC motif-containing protein [Bacillota bacterium]|nr:UvrB/UvrC motif-containing protein [Bacillota bacterium]
MICEECKKKNATVHFTHMVNGKMVETHLCEECAVKKGMYILDLSQFSIPNLLGSIFGMQHPVNNMPTMAEIDSCPNCGMKFMEIRKTGKLGCSECYHAYEKELEPTLRRIHGNSQHQGKIPSRSGGKVLIKKKIDTLKQQLQEAVASEKYEIAAEIRDSIKALEKGLQ